MIEHIFRSRRFWVSLALLLGLIWLSRFPLLITVGVVCLTFFTYPRALRPLKSYKFWIAIILLVVIVPLFTGTKDGRFLGIPYSPERLEQTLVMALRGIGVFLLIQVLTMDIASERFTGALRKLGLSRYESLIDLSKRVIPNARRIFKSRWGQVKTDYKRRGFRLQSVLDIIGYLFADLIHLSEQLNQGEILDPQQQLSNLITKIERHADPVLIIVSGPPGQGKTHWLQSLVDALKKDRQSVAGLLTIRKHQEPDDNFWEQWLVNIATGEEKRLSSVTPQKDSIQTDRYYISRDTLSWGNSVLQNQATLQRHWLVVDEIGILEKAQDGFSPSFQPINDQFHGHLVIAVRKSLIPGLQDFLSRTMPAIARRERYFMLV